MAKKRQRGGVRKACHLLRRNGLRLNIKRVPRLWREERLQGSPRKKRKGKPARVCTPLLRAAHPNPVQPERRRRFAARWSLDFPLEATEGKNKRQFLSIGDDFTRECLAIEVATSLPWAKGIGALSGRFALHGAPAYLRSDNGPEFLAETLFLSVSEARVLSEGFRREYNQERPPPSLGYLTPCEFKQQWLQEQSQTSEDELSRWPKIWEPCQRHSFNA